MANMITASRIGFSIALLYCPIFSSTFYAVYFLAGISDMIDGPIARATNTVSLFGSKLDSIADLMFLMSAASRILPQTVFPIWLWIWIDGVKLL